MNSRDKLNSLIGKTVSGVTTMNFDGHDAGGLVLIFADGTTLNVSENYVESGGGCWAHFSVSVGTET